MSSMKTTELVKEVHEYFVHHMHEESRGIGETKGHHGIFVKTVPSSECGLRNILLFNLELMISSRKSFLENTLAPLS